MMQTGSVTRHGRGGAPTRPGGRGGQGVSARHPPRRADGLEVRRREPARRREPRDEGEGAEAGPRREDPAARGRRTRSRSSTGPGPMRHHRRLNPPNGAGAGVPSALSLTPPCVLQACARRGALVRATCAGQVVLGLLDGVHRLREASSGRRSAPPRRPSRRRDPGVGRWCVGGKHHDRGVEGQHPPSQQAGHDGCFGHDPLRQPGRANDAARARSALCRGAFSHVVGLRGGIAVAQGASSIHHGSFTSPVDPAATRCPRLRP
jgi:hypothetical protein